MTVEIISLSISTKVWDRAGVELATPGSAVRHASVARHVTHCATRPGLVAVEWLYGYAKVSFTRDFQQCGMRDQQSLRSEPLQVA